MARQEYLMQVAADVNEALDKAAQLKRHQGAILRTLYNYGPNAGVGYDISNAQIMHLVQLRSPEASMVLAEHAQWANRESLKALSLAAKDAVEAAEAANRANAAVMKALRRPSAEFVMYQEKPMLTEPWVATPTKPVNEEGQPIKGIHIAVPPKGINLHDLADWLQQNPGPPERGPAPDIEVLYEMNGQWMPPMKKFKDIDGPSVPVSGALVAKDPRSDKWEAERQQAEAEAAAEEAKRSALQQQVDQAQAKATAKAKEEAAKAQAVAQTMAAEKIRSAGPGALAALAGGGAGGLGAMTALGGGGLGAMTAMRTVPPMLLLLPAAISLGGAIPRRACRRRRSCSFFGAATELRPVVAEAGASSASRNASCERRRPR